MTGPAPHPLPFRDALRVWAKVALHSFGGPAGQIAVMHELVVEQHRWISERRFLAALNYCMLLPGPEAQQLATYIGWLLHGFRGGLAAGWLFVLPGFLAILALSLLYTSFAGVSAMVGLFVGLKAAVLAIIVHAVIRIGRRVLRNPTMVALAGAAFVALFVFHVPFPLVIGCAALLGWIGSIVRPETFSLVGGHGATQTNSEQPTLIDQLGVQPWMRPSLRRTAAVVIVCLVLWFGPLLALWLALGADHVLVAEGVLFSKAAMVTFGGAYAVLPYIAQQAVETYGWLQPGEMLDGLGMAETTPGPLIQVVQFVGYMGAYRNPGSLDPHVAALIGSVLTTWVTFVPCFMWIFAGAPYIEALQGRRGLTGALTAITAAIVGVILNLAVWFSLHTLFGELREVEWLGLSHGIPVLSSVHVVPAVLAVASGFALARYKDRMLVILGACALIGMLVRVLTN